MTVNQGGYVWWYLDALSDDGAHGLTIIAFIGSVFSPYYAWARRRGPADPANHCALNVALYGPCGKRWAMTERGAGSLRRDADRLAIGPSTLHWNQCALTVTIDEVAVPVPRRIRGTVRLVPSAIETRVLALDEDGLHRWRPIAPCADVEIALSSPSLSWRGRAYFDTNSGDRALEDDFQRWTWSWAVVPGGTVVRYDVTPWTPRNSPPACHALRHGRRRNGSGAGRRDGTPPHMVGYRPKHRRGAWAYAEGDRDAGEHPVLCPLDRNDAPGRRKRDRDA